MSAPDVPSISTDQIAQVLQRTELGVALWRAATFEAIAEVQQARIAELEQQKAPAATPEQPGE